MHVSVVDICIKNYNKIIGFSPGKMGYFFYNLIRYKLFILAAYRTVLHCKMYGKQLLGWGPCFFGHVMIKRHFSSESCHFYVGANCTILEEYYLLGYNAM
jgi:hypothetical protein